MILPSLVLLVALGAGGNEIVLDAFNYGDSAAAAKAWSPSSGTPAVTVVEDGGRKVVEVAAPFAAQPKLERTIIDRRAEFDLAAPGEFMLDVAANDPEVAGQVSLYFRSGGGWYAAGSSLSKKGWQTVRFSKASFRVEGKPTGWHKIDGVRVSFWQGAPRNTTFRLGRLGASWNDVALVIPTARSEEDGEARTAIRTAEAVTGLLAELGLGADAVEDRAVARGALQRRHVAILAYNPRLSDQSADALARFVEQGGKLVVCYQLPPRLEKVLGFGKAKYVRPATPDQFSEIRFVAAPVPGLPTSMRQNSWNITAAEPIDSTTQVIGYWYDGQGKPTGHAAVLLSDRGAFFSHVLLPDDRENKKAFLAAILGRLYSPLWKQMAQSELERVHRVGHLMIPEEVARYARGRGAQAEEAAKLGMALLQKADLLAREAEFPKAIEHARLAHEELVAAYLRATPPRSPEGRAFWEHSGLGAYPGDWERTAQELSKAGFNMVIPNMLWGGVAHYASDLLPRSPQFEKHGDQIAQCVQAAHRHGLEVHVWKVNYNLSRAPKEFIEKLRAAGRTQVTVQGKAEDWLCPSHPENFQLERDSMLEVARKYDVDGIHFDYIRYPGGENCFCEGCRQRFEAARGSKVAKWPSDCFSGPDRDAYRDFRCQQITRLVEAVSREARKIKPRLRISAAVFNSYPSCRDSVGQDWPLWVKAGYLDFLCPMDYTESDLAFGSLVSNQLKLVAGRIPVYPGIGATASSSALPVDRVVGQIHHARALGAAGFTIFNLDRTTIHSLAPGVGLGAGSKPAVPPHRKD